MEAIRRVSLPAHALLQPARPGPISDGTLYLVFDEQFSYHRDRTQEQNRELVEKAVEKVTGRPVTVSCVLEGEQQTAAAHSEPSDAQRQPGAHTMKTEPETRSEQPRGKNPSDSSSEQSEQSDKRMAGRQQAAESADSPEGESGDDSGGGEGGSDEGEESGDPSEMLQEFLDAFDGRVVGTMTDMNVPPGSKGHDEDETPG